MTDVARKDAPPAAMAEHRAAVARLRQAYNAMPPGTPVRLAKRTSNLFRFRAPAAGRGARARPGSTCPPSATCCPWTPPRASPSSAA